MIAVLGCDALVPLGLRVLGFHPGMTRKVSVATESGHAAARGFQGFVDWTTTGREEAPVALSASD